MTQSPKEIPIIDIFAGPGGLSEGFHSAGPSDCGLKFTSVLSIEKDPVACQTLRLRSFFHQFPRGQAPQAYYRFARGEIPLEDLFKYREWAEASRRVWNAELGKVSVAELHGRIKESLGGRQNWILLGGPPCQAYSLVGRARMTGLGFAGRAARAEGSDIEPLRLDRLSKFAKDTRHTLYREYLRVVAVHQPAVFVMENVKGILSSKISKGNVSEHVFKQIRCDLSSPWRALDDDPLLGELKRFSDGSRKKYRLYSFVTEAGGNDVSDVEFLIRCEQYGVPQARHRVVLLGVREDLYGRPEVLQRRNSSVCVRDVLEGFPVLRSGLSKEKDTPEAWSAALRACFPRHLSSKLTNEDVRKSISKIIDRTAVRLSRGSSFMASAIPPVEKSTPLFRWLTDKRIGGVLQHESRAHMNSDLGRYLFASATAAQSARSPRLPDWPLFLLPRHRNVDRSQSRRRGSEGMFVDRFKVQIWDKPSSTVTSHIAKDGHYFIHPDPSQCRSLTVREAARLQTFPDNYFFCGNRTQQYHQVGNAVPPFLALQIAEVVGEYLLSVAAPKKVSRLDSAMSDGVLGS
jgi:DNA (cytosine-5)-methyltransferase 1